MSRPYWNGISKDGTLPYIDTRIKRMEITTAIELLLRRDAITIKAINLHYPENLFLRLPPEIRNKIYTFALDIGSLPASKTRVPHNSQLPNSERKSTNALSLCKQINAEASSLTEAFDIAYIPILSSTNYAKLISNVVQHGPSTLSRIQRTILAGLTTFKHIHLHLHVGYRMSSDISDEEPYLDTSVAYTYGRIRQALLIYTCASRFIFQGLGKGSIERNAIVHFDHLFSDWCHMLTMADCYTFKHLARIMGEDKSTDWEVRYYVHTGGQIKEQQWSAWDWLLTRDYKNLEKLCSKFPNIKLVAEVYGEKTWSLEGKAAGVTRSITPSSTLWPSWPDDVPWRRFERVRSDEPVLPEDDA